MAIVIKGQTRINGNARVNFPPTPTAYLDFTRGYANGLNPLPSTVTFTRADSAAVATQVGPNGLVRRAAHNIFFDSRPVNWGTAQVTPSTSGTAPDGTATASLLIPTPALTQHFISTNAASSGTTTFSVYLKAAGYRWAALTGNGAGFTTFDLTDGVIGTISSGVTANMISVGSGWYRCSVTQTYSTSTSYIFIEPSNSQATWSGDGVSGIYAWGAQLEQNLTPSYYVPTTAGAVYANTPRFDYDPVTLQPKGLLIEEQRANIAPFVGNYTQINCSFTGATTTAPDGTSITPLTVTTTAVTNSYAVVTATANTMTYSIYAKKGSAATDVNRFGFYNSTTGLDVLFFNLNYDTGAITYAVGSSGVSAVNVGNGWWRISITPPSGITSGNTIIIYQGFSGSPETAGKFAYVWGAQLEAGSFATSYIVGTATRSADVAQLTGAALTTLQGANWSFIGEIGQSPSGFVPVGIIGQNAFGKNAVRINGSVVDLLLWVDDGTTQAFVSPFNMTLRNNRIGISGTSSATSMVANAGTVQNIAKGMSWAGGAYLGFGPSAGGNPLNSTYRSVSIYSTRLSDPQLQILSVATPPTLTVKGATTISGSTTVR